MFAKIICIFILLFFWFYYYLLKFLNPSYAIINIRSFSWSCNTHTMSFACCEVYYFLSFITLLHFYLIHILNMAPDCCNGPKTSMFPWGHQHCTRWTSCTLGCRSTCPGMSPPSHHAPCPGCCHQWCHKWTWWIQSTHQERRWELGSLLPDVKLDI